MQHVDIATCHAANKPGRPTVKRVTKQQKEADAAHAMWAYYRDNKATLKGNIGNHREEILQGLLAGVPVELAFAPYAKPLGLGVVLAVRAAA
jgi:hypothetical protein